MRNDHGFNRPSVLRGGVLRLLLALCLMAPMLAARAVAADTIEGHAIVRSDGSLWIKNRVIVLFGVYLPPTDRQCQDWISPIRCDSRSVLALDLKVRGFITCFPQGEDGEGRIHAVCYVGRTGLSPGEDLGAYLIQWGWALALPNAPFEYHAMERIAERRGLGVWGFFVDSYSDPGHRHPW
ncbi:MAG: thermonuclease family protein [Bdellovibrio bacteriovorus]